MHIICSSRQPGAPNEITEALNLRLTYTDPFAYLFDRMCQRDSNGFPPGLFCFDQSTMASILLKLFTASFRVEYFYDTGSILPLTFSKK